MAAAKEIAILLGALTVAALIGTLALSIALLASYEITTPNHFSSSDIGAAFYVWFVAAIVGVPLALLAGAPLYLALQRFALFNWLSASVVGAILGFLVSLAGTSGLPWQTCSAVGVVSALVAWLLLKRSNYSFQRTPVHRLRFLQTANSTSKCTAPRLGSERGDLGHWR
jgi:hypothetical protein